MKGDFVNFDKNSISYLKNSNLKPRAELTGMGSLVDEDDGSEEFDLRGALKQSS